MNDDAAAEGMKFAEELQTEQRELTDLVSFLAPLKSPSARQTDQGSPQAAVGDFLHPNLLQQFIFIQLLKCYTTGDLIGQNISDSGRFRRPQERWRGWKRTS